ncbi:uncharacterized protein ARMOST_06947 [Armillaria ostoyae]|uniref:Uncharacterized protein n=1 Tax=Armillaria ostoyae TaxID=47428 RepID=A0A284R4F1_ARMOS|nr:uncharacterized protein ARMOST_06947 [Armillaria ostoyae]
MPSPYSRMTGLTWTESIYNDFDHFNYDEGTFRSYTPKLPGAHRGYTSWEKPDPIPQPIGHYANNAPHLGIKPVLLQPPKPFKGNYDNIEHFLGDCTTYFKMFASFFQLSSQTIPFAASYFEGTAKDWWVYKRQEYWAESDWDPTPPQF